MDGTTLVLLPGMDGTGLLFGPLIETLDGRFKTEVVAYPPATPLSYEELLPIVEAALPREAPYILLGESFSGPLAIMAASENPKNMRALILVSTFIRNPLPWLPKRARALARPPLFKLSRSFIVAKALASGHASPLLIGLLNKAHSMVAPSVMASRAKSILSVEVEANLKAVRAPVFLLRGANDLVVPRKNLREIQKARQDIRVFTIPGPHLILQTRPSESAAIIGRIADMIE
jgi:pimeloyl-ACP methyl ester carboxylesterase